MCHWPSFMSVHDLWKEGPAVGARANQEKNDGQDALEVEDCRLEGEKKEEWGHQSTKNHPQYTTSLFSVLASTIQSSDKHTTTNMPLFTVLWLCVCATFCLQSQFWSDTISVTLLMSFRISVWLTVGMTRFLLLLHVYVRTSWEVNRLT